MRQLTNNSISAGEKLIVTGKSGTVYRYVVQAITYARYHDRGMQLTETRVTATNTANDFNAVFDVAQLIKMKAMVCPAGMGFI